MFIPSPFYPTRTSSKTIWNFLVTSTLPVPIWNHLKVITGTHTHTHLYSLFFSILGQCCKNSISAISNGQSLKHLNIQHYWGSHPPLCQQGQRALISRQTTTEQHPPTTTVFLRMIPADWVETSGCFNDGAVMLLQ